MLKRWLLPPSRVLATFGLSTADTLLPCHTVLPTKDSRAYRSEQEILVTHTNCHLSGVLWFWKLLDMMKHGSVLCWSYSVQGPLLDPPFR